MLLLVLDREEGVEPGPFAEGEDGGGDLIDRVALDDAVTGDAVDRATSRVEEAHVVVDLGRCCHGGARVARRVLLLDRDRRGEAVDEVYVGLLDAFEELACIGGQGLDVATLALGVNGIEGERRLA